jgi:transcriptional regulator with XRE-family HTH domain
MTATGYPDYRILADLAGVTQRQAAEYLGVSVSAVEAWSIGVRSPRLESLVGLIQLVERIEAVSAELMASADVDRAAGRKVRIMIYEADERVRAAHGLPYIGCYLRAMAPVWWREFKDARDVEYVRGGSSA